jgi:hypothetical protein
MIVKAFSFSASLSEPYPRRVAVETAVYAVSEGALRRLECRGRGFSFELDALDFDAEFGDVLQLTSADVIRGLAGGSFECRVSECDAEGALLKVYNATVNGRSYKLLAAYKPAEGKLLKVYADIVTNLAPWGERARAVSNLLGLAPSALESV